jgi:hypothetical protein
MWKSDKNETFDVLFILFDIVIFVVVINSFRRCDNLLFDVVIIRFSTFWSTQKTFLTFWFRRSDQLKRPFRRSEIFGLSTFWSSTFRPPPDIINYGRWTIIDSRQLVWDARTFEPFLNWMCQRFIFTPLEMYRLPCLVFYFYTGVKT